MSWLKVFNSKHGVTVQLEDSVPVRMMVLWTHEGKTCWLISTPRQEIEVVLTRTGLIRLSKPRALKIAKIS